MNLYVGTYTTGRKGEGIYLYRFNLSSGELKHVKTFKGVSDPSFLAIEKRGRYLYAVNEVEEFAGKPGGAVSAFSVEQGTGDLKFLNQQPSLGSAPCHLLLDKTGSFLLVANYGAGNASVLPIGPDGSLGAATGMVQHQGSGPNRKRQAGPHAHCVTLDDSEQHAFVTDLGLDKIMAYRFDAQKGKLTPHQPPWVQVKPGAGPRHFTFHPGGGYGYVINEMGSTVTAFAYDRATATLSEIQTVSTLPKNFSGANDGAEVCISPSGKFLYGSNRGHNSIVVFAIEESTGKLNFVQHQQTLGKTPRHFTIDPTGAFLLAANQGSDTVVVFRINQSDGKLTPAGQSAKVPSPVCLLLA